MMNHRAYFFSISIVVTLVFSASSMSQGVMLRHQFEPGAKAYVKTLVQMKGDSIIHGKQAPTDMSINMLREINAQSVDPAGVADLQVDVMRMTTKGTMGEEIFSEDLKDDALQKTMFNQSSMQMQVSPLGKVKGSDDSGLKELGISLPDNMSSGGGFEFPTFPSEGVKVGDQWSENGQIIPRNAKQGDVQGQRVYLLERIQNTAQGKAAIIRYRKTTDFSNLGLGDLTTASQSGAGGAPAAMLEGLTIQLEGVIEFNIDKGKVTQSEQHGLWKLNMKSNWEGSNKPVKTQQGMKIRIQSQFRWEPAESQLIAP
ncbi:MAG: hypothetical protein P9L94_06170 [Candidatus Hinthialibacter antarcticus]|nr:hypothetical protein [Candidatus Hinthialibacter antarcticus]